MTRVKRCHFSRSESRDDNNRRTFATRFLLRTTSTTLLLEFHSSTGSVDAESCAHCRQRHSSLDCSKLWTHVASLEAAIAAELWDEPVMSEKVTSLLVKTYDFHLRDRWTCRREAV